MVIEYFIQFMLLMLPFLGEIFFNFHQFSQGVAIGLDYIAVWLRRFSIYGDNFIFHHHPQGVAIGLKYITLSGRKPYPQGVAIGLVYIALWLRRFSIQGENIFYFLFFRLKA